MSAFPVFSVVIPVFNAEKYIGSTIQGVLDQTFLDWELIVVDDCSNDDSVAIVEQFCAKDRRIHLIKTSVNFGGPAGPRNIGIKSSTGSFIALLDADDIWRPEKLERIFSRIRSGHGDIFYHREMRFENLPGDCSVEIRTANTSDISNLLFYLLKKGNIFSPSAIVIRKEILLQELFDEDSSLHGVEDFDLWLRLAKKGVLFTFIDEVLGFYRIHPGGISRNFRKHGTKERCLLRKVFAKFLPESFPGMFIIGKLKLLRSIMANMVRSLRYNGLADFSFYLSEALGVLRGKY